MAVSVFDLFKIGIGPSSSHTVGPMRAARQFVQRLQTQNQLTQVARIECLLYGSLAATGKGHGSDKAVLLGLMGHDPETVPINAIEGWLAEIRSRQQVALAQVHLVAFNERHDLRMLMQKTLPFHSNGLQLSAWDAQGLLLEKRTYYSVGGGFVVCDQEIQHGSHQHPIAPDFTQLPLPFHSAVDLLALCRTHSLTIAQLMLRNEAHWRQETETRDGLQRIWHAMQDCVQRGCETEGTLPGGFKVRRRAPSLWRQLQATIPGDPLLVIDWVNLFALAVNEENAAGGRVVTAPTNGAAGILPAVLHYHQRFVPGSTQQQIEEFLLTAAAIGILYKENASISGAEVGCQGEVGVACSMAAGALCAVLGGTLEQIENAAEIGMEHHLGLTCDPVGGLVQIPCIERNAIAAVKAINAARMALRGDGRHTVSLDQVIKTMRETGADMKTQYKETARGGLALNIVEC